jgi:hypothetical protein
MFYSKLSLNKIREKSILILYPTAQPNPAEPLHTIPPDSVDLVPDLLPATALSGVARSRSQGWP